MKKTIYISEDYWVQYRDILLKFIQRRVDDPVLAEDLLQTVLLKAVERLHTVQQPDKLLPWLYQITRNTIIDHYRRATTEPLPDNIEIAEDDEIQAVVADCGVIDAVDNLPPKYRQALLLYEVEGIAQKDIAERLGLSISGAKSRIQRARQMLRDTILACCDVKLDRRGAPIDFVPRAPEGCWCGVH